MEKVVYDLNIDDVMPNRFQPRLKFDEKALNELADSIKRHGVFQPIIVRKIGDKYEIIAGERRYKASVLAGKRDIPAIIVDMNDNTSSEVALLENVQRENLSPIEEAVSYKKILDMGYLTQAQLAEKLGVAQPTVANKLRLLDLTPEVQDALLEGQISERHARSLLRLKDAIDQIDMLDRIVKERLTVRKTDEEINKVLLSDDSDSLEILDFLSPVKEEKMENNIFNNTSSQIVDPFANEVPTSNQQVSVNPVDITKIQEQPTINVPQSQIVDPFINENTSSNEVNPGFMDVAKIQEEATDINVAKPQADLDTLLKPSEFKIEIDPEEELKNEEPIRNGKFFNFGDEQETEDNNNIFNKLDNNNVPDFLQPTSLAPDEEIPLENLRPVQKDVTYEQPVSNPVPEEDLKPSDKIVSIEELDKPFEEEKFNPENYNNYNYSMDEEIQLQKPIIEKPPVTEASLKDAINILRECSDKLSNLGFKVDLEEFDFDDMYQAIFKIDKK